MAEPDISVGLKRAIAWHTCVDLARHHPTLDLRIFETHPGGGQYDCLTVFREGLTEVVSFNLAGSSLLLGPPVGRARDRDGLTQRHPEAGLWRYPQAGLARDRSELASDIEARLGFPDRVPPRHTATGLALSVISVLMDRVALGSRPVDARCGWQDGSYGASAAPWATGLVAAPADAAPWQDRMRVYGRFWALDRAMHSVDRPVILDLASSAVWLRGVPSGSLLDRFRHGEGVRALAWWLEGALDPESA